jgi:hypothetical protein
MKLLSKYKSLRSYTDKGLIGRIFNKLRFKIARKMDRSEKHCWADLAMFGMGYNYKGVMNCGGSACKIESETHQSGGCYCGKFYKGVLCEKANSEGPEIIYNTPPF